MGVDKLQVGEVKMKKTPDVLVVTDEMIEKAEELAQRYEEELITSPEEQKKVLEEIGQWKLRYELLLRDAKTYPNELHIKTALQSARERLNEWSELKALQMLQSVREREHISPKSLN